MLHEDVVGLILATVCGFLEEKGATVSPGELMRYLSEDKRCGHVPKKGNNPGVPCGKKVVPGNDYCRGCMGKGRGTKQEVEKGDAGVTDRKWGLRAIEDKPGYYYMPQLDYIVRREPNGTYLVLGCGETSVVRPLREEEKEKALNIGLRVLDAVDPPPPEWEGGNTLPTSL